MEEKKHPLRSKTLWANAALAVIGFFVAFKPELAEYLNEGYVLMALGFIGSGLRLVTKGKIVLE